MVCVVVISVIHAFACVCMPACMLFACFCMLLHACFCMLLQKVFTCFLFLNVGVTCHYYGMKEREMSRMRTTEDCVFLNVRVTCHYYGVRNVTHAHNRKLCVFKC